MTDSLKERFRQEKLNPHVDKSPKFGWGTFWIVMGFFQGGLALVFGVIAGKTTEVIPNRGSAFIVAVLGIGSAFGLLKRKLFGLYLVYACLALALLASIMDIVGGTAKGVVGGILILVVTPMWFLYFRNRKDWFL